VALFRAFLVLGTITLVILTSIVTNQVATIYTQSATVTKQSAAVYAATVVSTVHASDCDDNNTCTFETLDVDGFCMRKYYGKSTACHACYTTGHCDGQGGCTGDPTNCLGVCNQSASSDGFCDNLIKFNTDLINFESWTNGTRCLGGKCVGFAFMPTWRRGAQYGLFPFQFFLALDCQDLLDPDFYAANGTCLKIDRRLAYSATQLIPGGTTEWDQCLYYWNCNVMDQAQLLVDIGF